MVSRIFYSLAGIALSLWALKNTKKLVDNTARIGVAENFFGRGGTYTFVRIILVILILYFTFRMFGISDDVFNYIVKLIQSMIR